MKVFRKCNSCGSKWSYDAHYAANSNGVRCGNCGSDFTSQIVESPKPNSMFNKKQLQERLDKLKLMSPEELKAIEPWTKRYEEAILILKFIEFKKQFKAKEEQEYLVECKRLGGLFTIQPSDEFILELFLTDPEKFDSTQPRTF